MSGGDHQQVGRIAREPVNRRGDDNIAGREGLHQLLELRPVGGRARDLLAEHFFAPRRLQFGKLAGEVLRPGRDASIAVNHARIVHQKSAYKKRSFISALVSMQISLMGCTLANTPDHHDRRVSTRPKAALRRRSTQQTHDRIRILLFRWVALPTSWQGYAPHLSIREDDNGRSSEVA
jgi:hypothetical protein